MFCYSDMEHEVARCVGEYGVSPDIAESEIRRVNRNRIAHYEYYTGMKWGDPHHYNLMINTGSIDLKTACRLIADLYGNMRREA